MNQPVPTRIFINISAHNETYLWNIQLSVTVSLMSSIHCPKPCARLWYGLLIHYSPMIHKGIKKAVLHGNEGPPLLWLAILQALSPSALYLVYAFGGLLSPVQSSFPEAVDTRYSHLHTKKLQVPSGLCRVIDFPFSRWKAILAVMPAKILHKKANLSPAFSSPSPNPWGMML